MCSCLSTVSHTLIMLNLASEWTFSYITPQCIGTRNAINFLYNPGHVTLWYLKVIPVAYASLFFIFFIGEGGGGGELSCINTVLKYRENETQKLIQKHLFFLIENVLYPLKSNYPLA